MDVTDITGKHRQLLRVLMEQREIPGGTSFEDAILKFQELKGNFQLPEKNFRCLWGEYALAAGRYDLFRDGELETVRKYLTRQKKVFRKYKLYVRILATKKYLPGVWVETVEPGQILWEFSGVPKETARVLCREVSDLLETELQLISKKELLWEERMCCEYPVM